VIDVFVMAPMFARPHQDRIFKGGRAKNEDEEFYRKPGAKGEMRKQAMIAKGDAKAGGAEQNEKQDYLKPIDTEIPEVNGYGRDGEDKGSDKERAR
jgi:hypothetical protein